MNYKTSYHNIRFAYIVLYFINRFLLYIPNTNFPSIITPTLILFGMIFIIIDLYYLKLNINSSYLLLISLFFIIYLFSIISNFNKNVYRDFEGYIITLIQIFGFFMYPSCLSRSKIQNQIKFLGITIIALTFFCACLSIYYFINQSYFQIGDIPAWGKIYGFINGRLYGIYVDPNLGAIVSCFSIFFSYYLLNNRIRIFFCINIILQLSYLLLSGSRTGFISFIGCVFILLFIFNSSKSNKYKVPVSVIIKKIIMFSLFIAFLNIFTQALSYLPLLKTNIEQQQQYLNPTANLNLTNLAIEQPANISRNELQTDNSNGRIQLWKDGLKIFKEYPLIGIGKSNIQDMAKIICPDSNLALLNFTTHCGYLELLVSIGIVGFTIMFLFLSLIVARYLKYLWIKKNKLSPVDTCVGCILFICIVSAAFLAEIFMVNTFISNIFWLFLGYALSLMKQHNTHEEVIKHESFNNCSAIIQCREISE